MNSHAGKKIHIVSTVNGQVNEGMRNVATHIAKAFEKNNEVRYSGLKDILSIVRNSCSCDVTMVFARANKLVYWLSRIIGFFSLIISVNFFPLIGVLKSGREGSWRRSDQDLFSEIMR